MNKFRPYSFQKVASDREEKHTIDPDEGIDEVDEIDGDEQLALVWCSTHHAWEWHWIPLGGG